MTTLFLASALASGSPVHIVRRAKVGSGVVTYCTGRHLGLALPREGRATCRGCLRRAALNGVDPSLPARQDEAGSVRFLLVVLVLAGRSP